MQFITLILAMAVFLAIPAHAATPIAPHLLGISITADDKATSLELDLSAHVSLSTIVKPDRVEIVLPTAVWDRSLPVKGAGGGLITDYRKLPTPHGIAIVMHTNTRARIDSSQGEVDASGGQHITIRLVRETETYATLAPTVLYAPEIAESVVQESLGVGTGVETVPAQAVQNNQNNQNSRAAQAKPSTAGCTAHLEPAGRVGDASASYPVYKFSDCP
jgi:hypothetical protein